MSKKFLIFMIFSLLFLSGCHTNGENNDYTNSYTEDSQSVPNTNSPTTQNLSLSNYNQYLSFKINKYTSNISVNVVSKSGNFVVDNVTYSIRFNIDIVYKRNGYSNTKNKSFYFSHSGSGLGSETIDMFTIFMNHRPDQNYYVESYNIDYTISSVSGIVK